MPLNTDFLKLIKRNLEMLASKNFLPVPNSYFHMASVVAYQMSYLTTFLMPNIISQVCIDVIVQRLGDATAAGMYKLLLSSISGSASTISLYALPVCIMILLPTNLNWPFIRFASF